MNGNPFYVPPVVPDMSGQIMELGRMGMQKDNLAQQRAIEERRLTGQEAHQDRMFTNDTERLNVQKQEASINERKLPASQQNFGMSDILPFQATLKQRGYDKALQPAIDTIGEWAKDNKVTKGVAASNLVNQWDTFIKPQALEGLQKEYLKRSEDPNFKGSPKEKEMLSMIDTFTQMDGEKAKGVFFPSIVQEEENSKAAIEALKQERSKLLTPAEEAQQVRIAHEKREPKAPKEPASVERVYVDKFNGARHIIDLRNPVHKVWLAKYGKQLVPETEAKDMEFEGDKPAASKYQVKVIK
jgi:hypothetical protein